MNDVMWFLVLVLTTGTHPEAQNAAMKQHVMLPMPSREVCVQLIDTQRMSTFMRQPPGLYAPEWVIGHEVVSATCELVNQIEFGLTNPYLTRER